MRAVAVLVAACASLFAGASGATSDCIVAGGGTCPETLKMKVGKGCNTQAQQNLCAAKPGYWTPKKMTCEAQTTDTATCTETAVAAGGTTVSADGTACDGVTALDTASACEALLTKASDDAQDDNGATVTDVKACTYTVTVAAKDRPGFLSAWTTANGCVKALCPTDTRVDNNDCVPCEEGKSNYPGDDPEGDDTACKQQCTVAPVANGAFGNFCPGGKLLHGRKCNIDCNDGFELKRCKTTDGKNIKTELCNPSCGDGAISTKYPLDECVESSSLWPVMVIIGVLVMICIIVPLVFYFKTFKEFQTKQADGITWNGKGEEMQDGKVVQVQSPLNDVEAD